MTPHVKSFGPLFFRIFRAAGGGDGRPEATANRRVYLVTY